MCRLLCVRGDEPFEVRPHLAAFAKLARASREYQGDGWGCAWIEDGGWRVHRDVSPVWEDPDRPDGRTTLLLAHARSAFRGEGIRVENNMPFLDGTRAFIFNGELHGVRIRERGRIGAEKVFNFIQRFGGGDMGVALDRGLDAIARRTRYVRAMNVVVADVAGRVHFASRFSEDPDYFQMRVAEMEGARVLCSEPYPPPEADSASGSESDSDSRSDPDSESHSGFGGRAAWTRIGNGAVGAL